MDSQLGLLSRTDGSAKFAFGKTWALASVTGPIEVRLNQELPSRAALEVIVRPLSGIPGTAEKSLSTRLRDIFEQILLVHHHPRTLVQLVVQSLSVPRANGYGIHTPPDPPMVAALINASSLALLRASSIPIRAVVCAVAVGKEQGSGRLVVDPDSQSDQYERMGCFAFSFSGGRGQLMWADWQGEFEADELSKVVNAAQSGALGVHDYIRGVLTESLEGNSMDVS